MAFSIFDKKYYEREVCFVSRDSYPRTVKFQVCESDEYFYIQFSLTPSSDFKVRYKKDICLSFEECLLYISRTFNF